MGRYYPIRLPDVRQTRPHDCGPAVASVVWRLFGLSEKPVPCTPLDGTDPRTLESCLRPELAVQSGEMTLEDLRHHASLGRPVVCLVREDGLGHYVVVGGVVVAPGEHTPTPGPSSPPGLTVRFHDPLRGPCAEFAASFVSRWEDVDRWGFRYRRWGLAAWRQS